MAFDLELGTAAFDETIRSRIFCGGMAIALYAMRAAMMKSNFRTAGLILYGTLVCFTVFAGTASGKEDGAFLSTHPATNDRIQELRRMA